MTEPAEVSVQAPGGWGMRLVGRDAILMLIAAVAGAGILWINYQGFTTLTKQHVDLVDKQQELLSELQVMTYMLALPEAQRPRLAMPRRLRERLRGEEP